MTPSGAAPRPRAARRIALAALILGAGCGLPLDLVEHPGPQNTCSAASDCGAGAACVEGACVATEIDLAGLLVEVRPPANAAFGADTAHLFDPAEAGIPLVSKSGAPFIARMNPEIPEPAAIQGGIVRAHPETSLGQGCSLGPNRSLPAHVTFYRVSPFAGLRLDPVSATTDADPDADTRLLRVDLVPGTYDVYVEPDPVAGCNGDVAFPPALLTGVSVSAGATTLLLDLPVVGTLSGTITGFGSVDPAAWKIELVEPTRGLPISSGRVLVASAAGYEIHASVSVPDASVPIVRLSPPVADTLPTAFWAFPAAVSSKSPILEVDVDGLFAPAVEVSGNVLGVDGFTRIPASLTIQSSSLYGPNAGNAAFSIDTLDTDDNGVFSLFLPPGVYDFRAAPDDNGLAVTDRSFTIKPDVTCFCGQPFQLDPKLHIGGAVKTPRGERFAGATVTLGPAQSAVRAYWASTHTLAPRTSRVISVATSDEGSFSMLVDSGASDLVISPDPASGFPWLVRPRLALVGDAQLASFVITNPAILRGVVRDPKGDPVPNAEVTAWYPVRDAAAPGGLAGVVVKIATTSTDASGAYRLLLPSSI